MCSKANRQIIEMSLIFVSAMSRPSSTLVQDQESIYDSIAPQALSSTPHYSSPIHTSALPYSFPLQSTTPSQVAPHPQYNAQPSPVRKFSPSSNSVSSPTPQYISPPSQYIPVHHTSIASPPPSYLSSASQYIPAPCTVTSSPISQVSTEQGTLCPSVRLSPRQSLIGLLNPPFIIVHISKYY